MITAMTAPINNIMYYVTDIFALTICFLFTSINKNPVLWI